MLKYEKVAKQIELHIQEERLEQGSKLPILDDLAEQFNVSKNTIVKALDVLEIRGMVYQVRGSGIFVRQHKRRGYINMLESQGFKLSLKDFSLKSKLIKLEQIEPDEYLMEQLKLDKDDIIYFVKLMRYIENNPFCLECSYYSKKHVMYLNREIVEDSIFNYIINDLNLSIGFSDTFFRIASLNKEEAKWLEQKEGDASLRVETTYNLHNGQPFNHSILLYHKEQAQFFVPGTHY